MDNPSRTFPAGLSISIFLVVAMYLFPIMAALGISTDTSDWTMGFFGRVALQVIRLQVVHAKSFL